MCGWGNATAVAVTVCVFALPVVLMSSHVSLTGNCSGNAGSEPLDIWGVKRDALFCTLWDSEKCRNGIMNRTVGGDFMGAPQSLKVEGVLLKDNLGNFHPQVVITWEPPLAAAGFQNLKGFYVKIFRIPSNSIRCYVFDFSQSNFTSSDYKLKFRKKLLGLEGGSNNEYRLMMYTLPMSQDSKFKGQSFTLPQDGNSPGDWSPVLSYDKDNLKAPARITVRFSLAPKEYEFRTYNVKLSGDRYKPNVIHECYISLQHSSRCQGRIIEPPAENATSMAVTFHHLQADKYRIQIQPDDPHRDVTGQCLCYQEPSKSCISCLATRTGTITVAPQEAVVSTPSPPATDIITQVQAAESKAVVSTPSPPATDIITQVQAVESTLSNTFITAAATVTVLLGCGLIVTVVVVLWVKKQSVATRRLVYNNIPTDTDLSPAKNTLSLYARKVYLMYAEDHNNHVKVITNLALHLKKQCCCEVFFLRWFPREIQTVGAYEWILTHIDQADFVIIINSEAAFKLFEARHANVSLRRLDEGPEGDIFSIALTHVLTKSSEPWFFKKTILAYFDYTDENFLLKDVCPGVHYRLPEHFKEFVCHIHEMRGQSDIDEMVDLEATSSGKQLLEAIRKAIHFQKSDPQWFDKRFFCQDSGFDSVLPKWESAVGVDDSISIAKGPLRGMHIHPSESDNADESKSAVTYNTDYARCHGECVFDMLPPSEVSIGASTDSIYRRLDSINKQNEINTVRFIPVRQTQADAVETTHSTNIHDLPDTATLGHFQSDSLVTMGCKDV